MDKQDISTYKRGRSVRSIVLAAGITSGLVAAQPGVAWSATTATAHPKPARAAHRARRATPALSATPAGTATAASTATSARTGKALTHRAVTAHSRAVASGRGAARAASPAAAVPSTAAGCAADHVISSFNFVIDAVTLPRLRNHVSSGSLVTADFVVAAGCSAQVTLKAFTAPTGSFQPGNGKAEHLFDSRSSTVGAGRSTLGPIKVPRCFFEVDFTVGAFPNRAGQDFRVDSDTGGTIPCATGGGTTPPPTTIPKPRATLPPTVAVAAQSADVNAETTTASLAFTGPRDVGKTLPFGLFLVVSGYGFVAATRRRPEDIDPPSRGRLSSTR